MYVCVCMYVCAHACHCACVEVRGQLGRLGFLRDHLGPRVLTQVVRLRSKPLYYASPIF